MEKFVEILAGDTEVLGKTCPSAALSTTKLTSCPDAKVGRRGGEPMINLLSYGTALPYIVKTFLHIIIYTCTYHCEFTVLFDTMDV
jgi:hypothetical protein